MRKARLVIGLVLAVALVLSLIVPAGAQVEPPEVQADLAPGESMVVQKAVTTPEIPQVIDILLLEDETGSFSDDIANLQAVAPALWDAIAASGADFTMGVAGFRDFAQNGWGNGGDHVYRLLQDLTSTKTDFVNGINGLSASGGNDTPEAQLEALHYAADPSHAAIDSNGDGDTIDPEDTPQGLQPSWRPGAQRVVLLATDAACHETGDAGGWPGDAGTTSAAVTAGILQSAGIVVIGLTPGGAGTIPCVDTLAAGTGGSVQATTASGEDIMAAILAGLQELTTDVWWEVKADDGLTVQLDPAVHQDVPGGTTVSFDEKITADLDAPQCNTLTAIVTFFANSYPEPGEVIGRQKITVHVLDVTPPKLACIESVNPHGDNVPPAGKTTLPGAKGGQNEDGFYKLLARDNCDPDPAIYVSGFGPLKSGDVVKITEAPGALASMKKIGSSDGQAGAVVVHIIVPSDPVITAVDDSGNKATCTCCLVPPPPK